MAIGNPGYFAFAKPYQRRLYGARGALAAARLRFTHIFPPILIFPAGARNPVKLRHGTPVNPGPVFAGMSGE